MTDDRPCALCRARAPLRKSHVIPAFVFRWIKETSATGKLRNAADVRARVQDGHKEALLCGSCEQRLSVHERWFAGQVFRPKMNGEEARPSLCHPSLLRFVASISWRAAVVDAERLIRKYANHQRVVRRAVEGWRRFLQDPGAPAGGHYLFPLPNAVYTVSSERSVNWYLQRTAELSTLLIDHRPFVWWKLPGFACLSSLGAHPLPNAGANQVQPNGLSGDRWGIEAPQAVLELLMARASQISRSFDDIPEQHLETIGDDYAKNAERWASSPAAQAADIDRLNAFPTDFEGPS